MENDCGKLIENQALYDKLGEAIKGMPFEIYAIYSPEGPSDEFFGDCYCAAVSMLVPGLTFRVWFKIEDDGGIQIVWADRWHFG